MNKQIMEYLDKREVKHSNMGFMYLCDAIELGMKNEKNKYRMTGKDGIYTLVAGMHKGIEATPSRVERAIRHSIGASGWAFDNEESITNSEFIARAADELRPAAPVAKPEAEKGWPQVGNVVNVKGNNGAYKSGVYKGGGFIEFIGGTLEQYDTAEIIPF